MAGEFVAPFSAIPRTADRVYRAVYDGAATGVEMIEGMGVEASVGANSTWELCFHMPSTLPSGTAKLRLIAQANATTGDAKIDPQWASVAMEEDPGGATLNSETTQTLTWAAGDANVFKELVVTLDADTIVADEIVVMDLIFQNASWTLAAESVWQAFIFWE